MLNKTLSILMVLMLGMCYGSTPPVSPKIDGQYLGTPDQPDANNSLAGLRICDNLDEDAKKTIKENGFCFIKLSGTELNREKILLVTQGPDSDTFSYYKILNLHFITSGNTKKIEKTGFNFKASDGRTDMTTIQMNIYSSKYRGTPMSFVVQATDNHGNALKDNAGYKLIYVSPGYYRTVAPMHFQEGYVFMRKVTTFSDYVYYFLIVNLTTRDLERIQDGSTTQTQFIGDLDNGLTIKRNGTYLLIEGSPNNSDLVQRPQAKASDKPTITPPTATTESLGKTVEDRLSELEISVSHLSEAVDELKRIPKDPTHASTSTG